MENIYELLPVMNPAGPGLSVLIVEDEAAARIATHRYLQHCGYRVAAAGTAAEAIRKAREVHPDVLICDWQLAGEGDGVDVARLLQNELGVDVIFVTAHTLSELRKSAGDLRTVDYLRKPVSLGALAAAVSTVLPRPEHH